MEMVWELIMEDFLSAFIVLIMALLTFGLRKLYNVVEAVLGVQFAEKEIKHIAKSIYRVAQNYDELYQETLNRAAKRMSRRGFKIDKEELSDIVISTLRELK